MPRYIDIEPYEMDGDSHKIEWRADSQIKRVSTKDIPTANVVGKEILNSEYGGKITKYFCPHCCRFKKRRDIEEIITSSFPFPNIHRRLECKHCGENIVEITKEFERLAIAEMLCKIVEWDNVGAIKQAMRGAYTVVPMGWFKFEEEENEDDING